MSLLLREVLGFLIGAAAWMGVELAIAGTAALAATGATWNRARRLIGLAAVGGIVGAAAAVRIGVPSAWIPVVGARPLPVDWSAAGALCAAVVAARRVQAPAA